MGSLGARTMSLILLISFSVLAQSTALDNKGSQELPLQALQAVEHVETFRVSPDGKLVALIAIKPRVNYTGTSDDSLYNAWRGELQVIDVRTGTAIFRGATDEDFQNPEWSPDGTQLAFISGTKGNARLGVWSRTANESRLVSDAIPQTTPRVLNSRPAWLPNSREIILGVLPAGSLAASAAQHSAVDTAVAEAKDQTPATTGSAARIRIFNANAVEGDPFHRSNALTPPQQEFAMAAYYQADVALIDVRTGGYRRLLKGHSPINYHISPDGRTLAFMDLMGSLNGSAHRSLMNLVIMNLATGDPRVLVPDVIDVGSPIDTSWSPDSRWLAFFDGGEGVHNDCVLADANSGEVRRVGGAIQVALQSSNAPTGSKAAPPIWTSATESYALVGSSESETIWRITLDGMTVRAFKLPLQTDKLLTEMRGIAALHRESGYRTQLIVHTRDPLTKNQGFATVDTAAPALELRYEQPASIGDDGASLNGNDKMIGFSADGRVVVFFEQRADAPQQLWVTDRSFRRPRQLTHLSESVTRYHFGKSRLVRWRSPEGDTMMGALLLPAAYIPGKKYPLIVQLYGGTPLSDDLNTFGLSGPSPFALPDENLHRFSIRGYVVLSADTKARVGRPMTDIAQSLLPGLNQVIDDGFVDPKRVGIMGDSYGGYSVLSVLVQTNRFKAAVVSSGYGNLIESYGDMAPDGTGWRISWVEERQGRMGGSLWDHRDRFIENSPLFFLDRVTTPVLIIHGTADSAVAVHEADEVFLSLRRLGKAVRYVQYLGEDHEIVGSANVIDRDAQIDTWFDKYLEPDTEAAH
jgi:dipeptidyl aminopeptidase/acylaminoacyl peptidase